MATTQPREDTRSAAAPLPLVTTGLFALFLWVEPAWAAKAFEPLQNTGQAVLDFMTGPFARTVAAIAVAGLGYLGLSGRMAGSKAFTIVIAIVLIFGAVTIVDFLNETVG